MSTCINLVINKNILQLVCFVCFHPRQSTTLLNASTKYPQLIKNNSTVVKISDNNSSQLQPPLIIIEMLSAILDLKKVPQVCC